MSLQQGPSAPRSYGFASQVHAKEQKQRPKKANRSSNGKEITYSHNYQRLMRLGRKRTWDAAGINECPDRNPPATSSKGSTSATQLIAQQPGNRQLWTHTAVSQWISDTGASTHTQPALGMYTHASRSFSAISATFKESGQAGSQVFGTNASTTSRPNTQSIFGTSASLSSPRTVSAISATPIASEASISQTHSAIASTISGTSSQSDYETISHVPRTSASQISATNSESSFDSRSRNHDASPTAPTTSQRVSTELRYDLTGRNKGPAREGEARPRLTASDIQRLLVIPKGLVTQKYYGKSKAGARIAPPPLKERDRYGKQAGKTKPKMTVTELQKQFIIPRGLVTQKQYGKKAQARTTNLYAKGSYAGRLIELMHYHRSEYSIWANATIREEPLAVIEILSVSRAMTLQWAKCKTIFSNRTNPFFAYGVTRTHSTPRNHDSAGGDDTTEWMPLHELETRERATWSERGASLEQHDEPLDNNGEATPFSGPRSEFAMESESEPAEGLHRVRTQGRPSPSCNNMQVSESSGSIEEQGQEYCSGTTSAASQSLLFGALDMSVDALHFKEFLASGEIAPSGITLEDKDERCNAKNKETGANETGDQNTELDGMKDEGPADVEALAGKVMDRAVSGVSSIDDISSDSGESLALVPLNPLQATTGMWQQESVPWSMAVDTELGLKFDIIFSNLFNHSTLKVADRVKIHEPCRPVALFGYTAGEMSESEACVWIAERYVVDWQKFSL